MKKLIIVIFLAFVILIVYTLAHSYFIMRSLDVVILGAVIVVPTILIVSLLIRKG